MAVREHFRALRQELVAAAEEVYEAARREEAEADSTEEARDVDSMNVKTEDKYGYTSNDDETALTLAANTGMLHAMNVMKPVVGPKLRGAILKGNVEEVTTWAKKPDSAPIDSSGYNALMFAVAQPSQKMVSADVVEALLKSRHFDLEATAGDGPHNGMTALMIAIQQGNLPAVHLLLDAEANLETVDGRGRTALFHALKAKMHAFDMSKLLLEHEANFHRA
eukprot:gnl/TRDRNA2_/TRDRNA2_60037_c0_seq2.p1 gnl/TRDRNA2_/TRDRNA2_60037_c0~~gnl/TRDRNA2_/TRDRNA2_60037_c0_seq2.p1  ORF type:complete len:222 (-),score=55.89 gnl/TRDRNA2_/TRDRNA2_60037_c0_seq2:8-673(-)